MAKRKSSWKTHDPVMQGQQLYPPHPAARIAQTLQLPLTALLATLHHASRPCTHHRSSQLSNSWMPRWQNRGNLFNWKAQFTKSSACLQWLPHQQQSNWYRFGGAGTLQTSPQSTSFCQASRRGAHHLQMMFLCCLGNISLSKDVQSLSESLVRPKVFVSSWLLPL